MAPASGRPDVLHLVHRLPYPPDKGCRIRAFHSLRCLSAHANVHLACLADEPVDGAAVEALRSYAVRVAVVHVGGPGRWARALASLARGRTVTEGAFGSPALRRLVEGWAASTRFHATLSSASSMVPYQRLPALAGVPAVVDLVDVDSQKWLDYGKSSAWPKSWLYALEGRRLRALEAGLGAWARAVALVTPAEVALHRRSAPQSPVHAIGNGVDLEYFRPAPCAEEPAAAFVGQLDYRPNVDAACWLCRDIWPRVRQRRPDARVLLVGRKPVPAVQELAGLPGVELVGQVPDVRPHLARAAVAVVPLRLARGVQNKVLEALAMAKATVASPTTLAGLRGAAPGVICADTEGEWADAVVRLLGDERLRRELGAAGRAYVEEHHCWEHCLEPFLPLLGLAARDARSNGREAVASASGSDGGPP